MHTSIVSRHLADRGNNKILRTLPPHISSSEEILPHLTRRTLSQPRTNKSPFRKSYVHKVDAKSHASPLCPLCNTHTSSLQLHPHTHHIGNNDGNNDDNNDGKIMAPMMTPMMVSMMEPMKTPLMAPMMILIMAQMIAPMMSKIMTTMMATIMATMIATMM